VILKAVEIAMPESQALVTAAGDCSNRRESGFPRSRVSGITGCGQRPG